jgi:hypothetical protein
MFPYIFYVVVCIPRFFEKKPIESPQKKIVLRGKNIPKNSIYTLLMFYLVFFAYVPRHIFTSNLNL